MQAAVKEQGIGTDRKWTSLSPATRTPELQVTDAGEHRLNVSVIFTTVEGTMAALQTAGKLASQLGGRITLIVPEVVSYHLPLNRPPVLHDWNERRFRVLAEGSPVDTAVRFYLCRDRDETLARALRPHSLVVIGGKKRWWPTAEGRLVARLRKIGHEVVLTETE
jgi:hypothetical protein